MSPVARTKSASGLNVVLGCWLIVSPWIFGYSGNQDAMWNSIAAGIIVVVALVAASRVYSPGGARWSRARVSFQRLGHLV